MSHFLVYVIVESSLVLSARSDEAIKQRIHSLMEPYDESIEVDEYLDHCFCIGRKAVYQVEDRLSDEFGTMEKFRQDFWDIPEHKLPENRQRTEEEDAVIHAKWEELTAPRDEAREKYISEHPLRETPDATCSECKGTGKVNSTYNPRSRWDWYRVGGRWDGEITNNIQTSENGFNFDKKHETTRNNMMLLDETTSPIPDKWIPFAIVTPDGEWHEKGKMGWWACVSDKKANWKDIAREIFEKYRGDRKYLVVACDCHI